MFSNPPHAYQRETLFGLDQTLSFFLGLGPTATDGGDGRRLLTVTLNDAGAMNWLGTGYFGNVITSVAAHHTVAKGEDVKVVQVQLMKGRLFTKCERKRS